MGMTIDDDVKQKLLDSLAEEPAMVIATAYAYAKNYVMYGEDITKAWTTAVQQASIIQEVRQKAWIEAYDSFKENYENRLKADVVAMLTEIKDEASNICSTIWNCDSFTEGIRAYDKLIQQKINSLKENTDGNDPEDS